MNLGITLTDLVAALPDVAAQHARTSPTYALLEKAAAQAVKGSRLNQTEGLVARDQALDRREQRRPVERAGEAEEDGLVVGEGGLGAGLDERPELPLPG